MKKVFLIILSIVIVGLGLALFVRPPAVSNSNQTGTVRIVAGENFWGDIAKQIGGSNVSVTSIISDPSADPHLYESNAQNASAIASADVVLTNGLGYDDFMDKL